MQTQVNNSGNPFSRNAAIISINIAMKLGRHRPRCIYVQHKLR